AQPGWFAQGARRSRASHRTLRSGRGHGSPFGQALDHAPRALEPRQYGSVFGTAGASPVEPGNAAGAGKPALAGAESGIDGSPRGARGAAREARCVAATVSKLR